jgi:hypothetical protein
LAQLQQLLASIPHTGAQQQNAGGQPSGGGQPGGYGQAAFPNAIPNALSYLAQTIPNMQMFGGGGNPLNLSTGSTFTGSDLGAIGNDFAQGSEGSAAAAAAPSILSIFGF